MKVMVLKLKRQPLISSEYLEINGFFFVLKLSSDYLMLSDKLANAWFERIHLITKMIHNDWLYESKAKKIHFHH
ncbi:hypothetical protein [Staphylococcus ureilyticus]|uniref:hypothetical protein n=1 Tax=Staphylococcus ureilyticus TaxID=94138 RepID=UPI0029024D8A|nr:hypothetical protein [Staphylococcus ureilyticus]MDU0461136.1 hypothetical protein [Staphylococcus ureilyticus]